MFAIVYKSDGVPVCVQVPGVSPDPVVVWNSRRKAHGRAVSVLRFFRTNNAARAAALIRK